ncbi:MAG: glycosyltransferase [Bacteroidales bacterium]
MKVLFLSAWYPNRYDSMSGLFVRKHADAVSQFCEVHVLYLHQNPAIKKMEYVETTYHNIQEHYLYYPFSSSYCLKIFFFFKAYCIGLKKIFSSWGKPDLVHANILTRHGIIAYLLYIRYNIPYVITEHWSRYLPQNFSYTGILRKSITKRIVKKAAAVLPVCLNLKNAMIAQGLKNPNYITVNNVVDDFFFKSPSASTTETIPPRKIKRILYVSCFDEKSKNVCGLLRALKQCSLIRTDFECILAGTGKDQQMAVDYAKTLDLPSPLLRFVGEQNPEEIRQWLYNSDFLVLFSNYENAPVVLSESFATGTPVLATKTGGIPEMVTAENGCLVSPKKEEELSKMLSFMLDHFQEFNAENIRKNALKYSFLKVGEHLESIYRQTIKPN